jgi:hypothetical protein
MRNNITVNVQPYLHRYIVQSFGSDTVPLRNGRTLTRVIAPYLELLPSNDPDRETEEGFLPVHFELPGKMKTCSSATERVYYCYTMFRYSITPQGEAVVRRFLANSFKQSFRVYMDAYIERQEETKTEEKKNMVKSGVVSFLMKYHIDVDEKLVTSLTRDWYRHNEENECYLFSPLLY